VISASGKGGGVASPLSMLIAAVGVFAIGAIVSRYAWEVHAAGSLYDYVSRGLGERAGTAAGWLYYAGVTGLGVTEAYELVTSLVPARRPASASEVAAVVAWLLSDASSYVNGAVIPVDGAAVAMDVGTLPFDPRVQVRRDEAP